MKPCYSDIDKRVRVHVAGRGVEREQRPNLLILILILLLISRPEDEGVMITSKGKIKNQSAYSRFIP